MSYFLMSAIFPIFTAQRASNNFFTFFDLFMRLSRFAFALLCLFSLRFAVSVCAQETASTLVPLEGIVVNKQTGEAVIAASVRVQGSNRGTYTDKNGKFRLPLAKGSHTALIRSLGYEALEINFSAEEGAPPLRIELVPASVKLGAVDVVAEVSAAEIVRRAIANKDANRAKIRSSSGLVYSKTGLEIAVPKMLSLLMSKEQQANLDKMKSAQLETFSRVEKQYSPSVFTRKTILQRRQTANIPAQANTLVMDEFVDFTDAAMNVNGTRLVTPLGSSALDSYIYTILDRKQLGDRTVYVIGFKPRADVFPGFEGALQIIEGNYAIVQISAAPTKTTALRYFDELSFFQKFERFNNKTGAGEEAEVWLPTLLEANYGIKVELITGLAGVGIKLKTRSIVSELEVNPALPASFVPAKLSAKTDEKQGTQTTTNSSRSTVTMRVGSGSNGRSIKPAPVKASSTPATQTTTSGVSITSENETSITAVSTGADSVQSGFWETNALTELTVEEKETYRRVDSVVKATPPDTSKPSPSRVNPFALLEFRLATNAVVSALPVFNFTRTTDWLYGASVQLQWEAPAEEDTFTAVLLASGLMNLPYNKFFGSAALRLDVVRTEQATLSLAGEVFSNMTSLQNRRLLGERFTQLPFGTILYQHFLDFYRQEGFMASVLANVGKFDAALGVKQYAIINLPTILPNERANIPAQAGTYRLLQAEASWNLPPSNNLFAFASFVDDPQTSIGGRIVGRVGQDLSGFAPFGSVEGRMEFLQPTFYTGYAPMFLRLSVNAGYASSNVPLQEQFIAFRRIAFFGRGTDFATIPLNGLTGTEFVSIHLEHNCSDMLWRLVGLPTWKGRGLDFVLLAQTGKYNQRGTGILPTWRAGEYGEQAFAPSNEWHWEVGVGIARIPSFFSDFLNFRVDLLWGLGANTLPGNNFGFSVTCSVPF